MSFVVMHAGRPVRVSEDERQARDHAVRVAYRGERLRWSSTGKLMEYNRFTGFEVLRVPKVIEKEEITA